MKKLKLIAISIFISLAITGCFGDKKTVVGQEFGDYSFINEKFAGNKIAFSELPKNLCSFINENKLRELYPSASKILFDDGKTFQSKSCRFLIYMGEQEYDYLGGTIFAQEDVLAEGEDWRETWELKKKASKSAEYILGLGKTAIWIERKRELIVKMDNYSITITVPGSAFKEEEVAKKRNYKNIALEIAKSTNLF